MQYQPVFRISALFLVFLIGSTFLPYDKEKHQPSASDEPVTQLQTTTAPEPYRPQLQLQLIGQGTGYETPYYLFDSGKPGPNVLVEAGIHGDEKAGTYALDRLLYMIKVNAGKLIILPRMNILAFQEDKRYLNVDLNRVFAAYIPDSHYEYDLAKEINEMVGKEKIEYLLTLHESKYLHNPDEERSYGQTIVFGIDPQPAYLLDWIGRINALRESEQETFYPYYDPVDGSSTETLQATYDLKGGFCIETWRGFPMDVRIRLHTNVVLSFFEQVGLEYELPAL